MVIGFTLFHNNKPFQPPKTSAEPANIPVISTAHSAEPTVSLNKNVSPVTAETPAPNNISPKPAQKPEQLFKSWRQAIIIKNPANIEQLSITINGMGAEAIPFLNELALDDDNERVRAFAVRSLGRMRRTDLMPLFINLLRNDSSEFVRTNAVWSLGNLGGADALAAIEKASTDDKSENIRTQAKETLNRLNSNNPK